MLKSHRIAYVSTYYEQQLRSRRAPQLQAEHYCRSSSKLQKSVKTISELCKSLASSRSSPLLTILCVSDFIEHLGSHNVVCTVCPIRGSENSFTQHSSSTIVSHKVLCLFFTNMAKMLLYICSIPGSENLDSRTQQGQQTCHSAQVPRRLPSYALRCGLQA